MANRRHRAFNNLAFNIVTASTIFLGFMAVTPSAYALRCVDMHAGPARVLPTPISERIPTKAEQLFANRAPNLPAKDRMLEDIDLLRQSDPALAASAREARLAKERGQSLRVDLSGLESHMIFFIDGAYTKTVGDRGFSRPFVKFTKVDSNTLMIEHAGDAYPMIVRWSDGVAAPQRARAANENGKMVQLLELPSALKTRAGLNDLPRKFIYSLITGSHLNKFISGASSPIMRIASVLHDGKLTYDRPTQVESKQVRELLDTTPDLRRKIRSLLFVAPTATGKTKVLGDTIVNKVNAALAGRGRKLVVLMTKTPDLTGELAREIGEHLYNEISPRNFRLIQWGGENTEAMGTPELLKFIDSSDVPVVLVTSYPTLAARAKSEADQIQIFKRANSLMIDEAHNAGGETFTNVLRSAMAVATLDRGMPDPLNSLDIFGVTASPVTRIQRTADLFDAAFWAAVDSPGRWAQAQTRAHHELKSSERVLEWVRILEQYEKARDRGEINASEPQFYKPEERGFKFASIFKRDSGTSSSVDIARLKEVWPDIAPMIEGHGPGVIQTYPRDAAPIAETLSQLTGKNFVSLQKLNPTERGRVYEAFRSGGLYEGRPVDAIVGPIREGLDFPRAGWYLSFKKYVKFPENIQGPGRVVRLALNKLPPLIMFFGSEVNKIAYKDVRELVLTRLGRLPVKLPEGRLYTGARRNDESRIGQVIENLNIAMEGLVRIRSEVAKQMGDAKNLNAEKVVELQTLLKDVRLSGENREISQALKSFVTELNSFPFFTGQLRSTWTLTDRLLTLAKSAEGTKRRIKPEEEFWLKDPDVMEQVKLFRSLLPNIGPVPRAILETMDLRPVNVYELADSVNRFVEANGGKAPFTATAEARSLQSFTQQVLRTSPEAFWRRLNENSRKALEAEYQVQKGVTLEQAVSDFVSTYRMFPHLEFRLMHDADRNLVDGISDKLATELSDRMREGDLDVSRLSADAQRSLEDSEILQASVLNVVRSLRDLREDIGDAYVQRLRDEGILNYQTLSRTGDFRVLRVLDQLVTLNPSGDGRSQALQKMVTDRLAEVSP